GAGDPRSRSHHSNRRRFRSPSAVRLVRRRRLAPARGGTRGTQHRAGQMKVLAILAVVLLVMVQADPAADLAESGDRDAAEREYRELLAEDPTGPTLNYNLGTVLLLAERYDEARPYLDAAGAADSSVAGSAGFNSGNTDLLPAFADTLLPERDDRLRRSIEA